MFDQEFSESGQPIYRHKEPVPPREFPQGDPTVIDAIDRHISQYLGNPGYVFHEVVSPGIHIDVHIVPPTDRRKRFTLVTSGMSTKAMNVPQGSEGFRYAELVMALPPSWIAPDYKNIEIDVLASWPFKALQMIGRFPTNFDTWLSFGHTIPNGNPPEPFIPGYGFCALILMPPVSTPVDFWKLKISEDKNIHFYGLVPIFKEELDFKLKYGMEALMPRFDEAGVSELFLINRETSCPDSIPFEPQKHKGWLRRGK